MKINAKFKVMVVFLYITHALYYGLFLLRLKLSYIVACWQHIFRMWSLS